MYIKPLSTFDEVVDHYESIRPMKSKRYHIQEDVRPIGKRRRTWERIEKIDDNCYAFFCGGASQGDRLHTWGGQSVILTHPITKQEARLCAPVLWEKHEDGTETITVRNGAGPWQHNSNYSFLKRALPRNLYFLQTQRGEQYIQAIGQGQFFLPKRRTVPRCMKVYYDNLAQRYSDSRTSREKWGLFITEDDGSGMTFRREPHGTFTLISAKPKHMRKVPRISKDVKKGYRDYLAEVRAWCDANYQLMASTMDHTWGNAMRVEAAGIAKDHNMDWFKPTYGDCIFANSEPVHSREVLCSPDHPLHFHMLMSALEYYHSAVKDFKDNLSWKANEGRRGHEWRNVELIEEDQMADLKKFLTFRMNKWANDCFKFSHFETVEVK